MAMTVITFTTPPPIPFLQRGLTKYRCTRRPTLMVTNTNDETTNPQKSSTSGSGLRPGEMIVRFTNTPEGDDVLAAATPGDILLSVGDSVGIHIPRACVSGLCGSCTCDVISASGNGEPETIRACQTNVTDIDGTGEMIIDLARMRETRTRKIRNPMARFDNIDTEYKAGAQPMRRRGSAGGLLERACIECDSVGNLTCYQCDGCGFVLDNNDVKIDDELCLLCSGSGKLRCADCQGQGVVKMR